MAPRASRLFVALLLVASMAACSSKPAASGSATATSTLPPYPTEVHTSFVRSCTVSGSTTAAGCECIFNYTHSHVAYTQYQAEQQKAATLGHATDTSVDWIDAGAKACNIS